MLSASVCYEDRFYQKCVTFLFVHWAIEQRIGHEVHIGMSLTFKCERRVTDPSTQNNTTSQIQWSHWEQLYYTCVSVLRYVSSNSIMVVNQTVVYRILFFLNNLCSTLPKYDITNWNIMYVDNMYSCAYVVCQICTSAGLLKHIYSNCRW
jgi:hypothetical protein